MASWKNHWRRPILNLQDSKHNSLYCLQKLKIFSHLHKLQKQCLVLQTQNLQNSLIAMKNLENPKTSIASFNGCIHDWTYPPKLPLDLSMMWWLCQVNQMWHKVVDESLKWHALNIVKHHNLFYHHTIATQGLPRCYLKQCLQIEIHYLNPCFLDDTKIWDFGFKATLKLLMFLDLFT